MRPADAYQGIGDSLQADVMRFMAIIAFCLMAILALVRNVDAQPTAAVMTNTRTPDRVPAAPAPAKADRRTVPAAPRRNPVSPPRRPADPTPAETPARKAAEKPASSAPQPADAPGLTLRFASDRDFLRLVNRGTVRVFAFRNGEVLAVSADFQFRPAAAPGQLHELLPETIPDLMQAALAGATRSGGYRWGITLPDAVARQIRAYLSRGVNGELVIDRFGEVRLHEA